MCRSKVDDHPISHTDLSKWLMAKYPPIHAALNEEFLRKDLPAIIANSISDPSKWKRILTAVNDGLAENFQSNFKILKSYLSLLKEVNPDAVINYDTEEVPDENGRERFGRIALMFKCQSDVTRALKPVISLDGGFLKHPLWGSYQILVCGGQD